MKLYSSPSASLRRLALACGVALATTAAVTASRPARAQWAVDCVNCSTTWTQLLEYAKQAQQLETQLQQYETQLQQYANMVTNTVALPQEVWGTVQGDIMQVRNLSNAASLLSGNAGSIVTRLQSASGYANQAASLGNIAGQLTTWQQTIGNNVSTLGRTLGLQQDQQANNTALLTTLESHSQSAQGQMQAIQAGNELAHANAAQLQEIQATLSTTAQMQATGMAVDADRRASEDAAMLHFSTPQPIQTSGYPQY
jgi:P-type conjugative transfer protein TrbJ